MDRNTVGTMICKDCGKKTASITNKPYLKYSNLICSSCFHIEHTVPSYIPKEQYNKYWDLYLEKNL